jgi:hypothetical protein
VNSLLKHQLIILDEFGYIPIDQNAARLLYQIVSECYETRSLIITTNVPFSRWGTILTDDQMAAAMIDRIAHHGHLINFTGSSYRMRNALMRETHQRKDTPNQTPTPGNPAVVDPVFRTLTKQGRWLLGKDVSYEWDWETAQEVHAGV